MTTIRRHWISAIALLALFGTPHRCHADVEQYAPQISYDLRLPDPAIIALTQYWTNRSRRSKISVDASFLPENIASKLRHKGFHVIRRKPEGTPTDPHFPRNYYFPDYCWRPSSGTIYLWYEAVLPKSDDYHGIVELKKTDRGWRTADLPTSAVSVDMQAAIFKAYLYKPSKGVLHAYADDAKELHSLIGDMPFVRFEPAQIMPQTLGVAALEIEFVKAVWLDKSRAFVEYDMIAKAETMDLSDEHYRTVLMQKTDAGWKPYDIGVPAPGE